MTTHTILFLAADPSKTSGVALESEAHDIQSELERSGYRSCFKFETRWAVEPLDLLRELRRLNPTVVHFSAAREGTCSDRHEHGLFFHGRDGRAQFVSTAAIAETFGATGASVRLVVLNACYMAAQAQALLAHVDCVVGTDGGLRDAAAKAFAIGFYGGLAECHSVAAACNQGRAAISLTETQESSAADRPTLRSRAGVDPERIVLASPPSDSFQDQRLLDILRQLATVVGPAPGRRPDLFREIIEPAFRDLRDVHSDYVAMFQRVLRWIPQWRGDPQYHLRVTAAAEYLRDMRTRGAAVRVELRKLAEHLQGRSLSVYARGFADALLDYFPDGSLRELGHHRDAGWWKTASSLVLDRIDEDLNAARQHDLPGVVQNTIRALDRGWATVCDAFQLLRIEQFS